MPKVYKGKYIKTRSDYRENWTEDDQILINGEVAFEKDTGLYKVGNGVDSYNHLQYKSAYELSTKQGIAKLVIKDKHFVTNEKTNSYSYSQHGHIVNMGFSVRGVFDLDEADPSDIVQISFSGAPWNSIPNILINNCVIEGTAIPPDNIVMYMDIDMSVIKFKVTYKSKVNKDDESIEYEDYYEYSRDLQVQDLRDGSFYVRGSFKYFTDKEMPSTSIADWNKWDGISLNYNTSYFVQEDDGEHNLVMFNLDMKVDQNIVHHNLDNITINLGDTDIMIPPKIGELWKGGLLSTIGIKCFDPILFYEQIDGKNMFRLKQRIGPDLIPVLYKDIRSNVVRISGSIYYAI